MSKLGMLAAGAVGYVLGARAGRERYDQIVFQAQRLWTSPRVQQGVAEARDLAREKGPVVGERIVETAKHAGGAVASHVGSNDDDELPDRQAS
jgi:hypothetical protein